MKSRVICDSSSLISLSMNCMTPLIVEFSDSTDFIITKSVYDEIITNPRKSRHHLMGPLKFTSLVDNGILRIEKANKKEVDELLDVSNSIYYARGKPLKIIQSGEAEALALANDGDVLLMDERTLRFLVESPHDLKSLLKHRMHKDIGMDEKRLKDFKKFAQGVSIIRSSELVAVAFELGVLQRYFSGEKRELLESCLWALKYKGCSLSVKDIKEYIKMLH